MPNYKHHASWVTATLIVPLAIACGDGDDAAPVRDAGVDSMGTPRDGGADSSMMPGQGAEGQPCYPNGTCNAGLSCFSNLCVRVPGDAAGDAQSPPGDASSSDGSSDDADSGGDIWRDGKVIDASLIIPRGSTVTIAPGATVTLGPGVTVTVQGTLTASARASKATLTGRADPSDAGAMAWGGLIVDSGGTLSLDGVHLVNTSSAIVVKTGNANASYDYATITKSAAPFTVNAGGKLSTIYGVVTGTLGGSTLNGSFTAAHLDYDGNYSSTGFTISDASAVIRFDDSTLRGASGDLLNMPSAASVHIAYCDLQAAHGLFFANDVRTFDISYSNFHEATYAFVLFGTNSLNSGTVSSSNIYNNDVGIDARTNGHATFSGSYSVNRMADTILPASAVTVMTPSLSMVQGTGPRP